MIGEKGSSLEKARINCILHGKQAEQDVIQGFIQLQNVDGGFPFGMQKGSLSTINDTTVALWWMEELDLFASPSSMNAITYLLAIQHDDGSWEESTQLAPYDLPPWIQLGDLKTRLYLTACAAYWLAVGGYCSIPAFRKATHFLLRHQEPSGRLYGFWHTTWITLGVFLMAGKRYENVVNLGLQALSDLPLPEWEDSQIAWALDCLSKGGLPKTHPFIDACLQELFHRQKADGSWASEDGASYAVSATIQVIKTFKRYGLLSNN